MKEYHERTARKIAYLKGEVSDFPTKYTQQPEAGSAKLATRREKQVGVVNQVQQCSDEFGPAWDHDEPVLSRRDMPAAALDAWIAL